jgi:hypothetical protein
MYCCVHSNLLAQNIKHSYTSMLARLNWIFPQLSQVDFRLAVLPMLWM